jgi:phosphatidylglycerol:prolipoprotein diacylglycerol transferase
MDAVAAHQYWTFHLNPFIFQVKNIPFQWLYHWWGWLLVLGVFGGGFALSHFFMKSEVHKAFVQSCLVYLFVILCILFGLQAFQISWGLRWYSTMYLLGFLSFYAISLASIKKKTFMLTEDLLVTLVTFIIIGMLAGARTAYVFVYNWDYYFNHPLEAVATWEGGLSFHGGVVGIIAVTLYFCKKHKIPFFHLTDKMAFATPIGIGFGRLGNFMNGELWGRPIVHHVPWAVIFPYAGAEPRHPSQIYQSLGEGWGLFFTLLLLSRTKRKEGMLSAYFIVFYGVYRFCVEYFRAADVQVSYFHINHMDWAGANAYPDTQWWELLTMGQILCLLFVVAGLILMFFLRKNIEVGSPAWIRRNDEFFKRQKEQESKA